MLVVDTSPAAAAAPVAPAATAPVVDAQTQVATATVAPVAPTDAPPAPAEVVPLPAGSKAEIEALYKGGLNPADVDAYLAKHTPEVAAKLKEMFDGKDDIAFDEADPDPEDFSPLDDEAIAKLPEEAQAIVRNYNESLKRLLDEMDAAPKPPEGLDTLISDPVVALRMQQLQSGKTEIAAPSYEQALTAAGVDVPALQAKIQELFETEGGEAEAHALIAEANRISNAATAEIIRAQVREQAKQETAAAIENEKVANYYDRETDKLISSVPEFRSNAPKFLNGEINPAHPMSAFMAWAGKEQAEGRLPDSFVMKHGLGVVYHAWKADKAGGMQNFMGELRLSEADRMRSKLKGQKISALQSIQAQTPGSVGTTGTARVIVNGVDVAQAVADKSGRYLMAFGLPANKESEVVSAMKKYETSSQKY